MIYIFYVTVIIMNITLDLSQLRLLKVRRNWGNTEYVIADRNNLDETIKRSETLYSFKSYSFKSLNFWFLIQI